MVNEGIEPVNFLNDFLEIIYFIQQKKSIGEIDSNLSISEAEQEIINSIATDINTSTLVIFWQFTLKVLEEMSIVSNPILSLEMLIIRLIHLKDMPSYDKIIDSASNEDFSINLDKKELKIQNHDENIKILKEDKENMKSIKSQIKNITQTIPIESSLNIKNQKEEIQEEIKSFGDLINLSSTKKEIQLKYDLENNVNLVKFSKGKIDISFNENLDKNFVRNLSEKLYQWTKSRWVITLTKQEGQKTFSELKSIRKKEILEKEKESEVYKKFENIFSDIELIEVDKKD